MLTGESNERESESEREGEKGREGGRGERERDENSNNVMQCLVITSN